MAQTRIPLVKVIGVDLGIKKAAISIWDNGQLMVTDAYESPSTERCHQLEQVSAWLWWQINEAKPDYVVIEDTLIGNNRKYSIKLAQTMGACLSALTKWSSRVILANVSHWKKEVLGKGNADKVAIRFYVLSQDPTYAALCGDDQDQFDAVCIGYYGVILSERAGSTADAR